MVLNGVMYTLAHDRTTPLSPPSPNTNPLNFTGSLRWVATKVEFGRGRLLVRWQSGEGKKKGVDGKR